MTDTNPLYQPADVPAFAAIRPEHAAIIPQILDENRAAIEALIARGDFTWDGLMQPLERLENRLAKAVSPVAHLHAVTSTDEWRAAYEALRLRQRPRPARRAVSCHQKPARQR